VRTATAKVAVALPLLPSPHSLDLTRAPYDSEVMLGDFLARRQA
jgi:hypothetical protein